MCKSSPAVLARVRVPCAPDAQATSALGLLCPRSPNSHETQAWQAVPICAAEPPKSSSDGLSRSSIGGAPGCPSPGAPLSGLQKEGGGTPPMTPVCTPTRPGPCAHPALPRSTPHSITDSSRAEPIESFLVLSPALELRVERAVTSPLGVADGSLNSERKTASFSISPG